MVWTPGTGQIPQGNRREKETTPVKLPSPAFAWERVFSSSAGSNLNPFDHLSRNGKKVIWANCQYQTIEDQLVAFLLYIY
jgi:hypothetical protein